MKGGEADWVTEAASLPLAFAQVREDPALDFWVLDQLGRRARVALIASGGCTVAALATRADIEVLHCVDPNPAQLALGRFKLHLLQTAETDQRLRLLGHARLDPEKRAAGLAETLSCLDLGLEAFGPPEVVAACGPDHAGRYEHVFAALRLKLAPFAASLETLLRLSNVHEQTRCVAPGTSLGLALDAAFADVMASPNLMALFGAAAMRNPLDPFGIHFAKRLRWVLANQPAAGNAFLSQMLTGRFAPGAEHWWLRAPRINPTALISWDESAMTPTLKQRPGEFDMLHLSNILDWLDADEARETLDCAHTALRPGGWVIVRQLNSTLDIRALGSAFAWDGVAGQALLARDRSFFYRAIWVGRRR